MRTEPIFDMLKKIWTSRQISIGEDKRLFDINVKSVLLYGSETWTLTRKNMEQIQLFV